MLLKAFLNTWLMSLQSHLISKFSLSFIKITNICQSMSTEQRYIAEHQGHLNSSFGLVMHFIILFAFSLHGFSILLHLGLLIGDASQKCRLGV
jgi:hypothetical protein